MGGGGHSTFHRFLVRNRHAFHNSKEILRLPDTQSSALGREMRVQCCSDLLTQLRRHSHRMLAFCSMRARRPLALEPLGASFGSTQWIETATVSLDDARHPVPGYSVVTVCQCNRHFVVPAFVRHSFVFATGLECAYGTKSCARRLRGSLSKRNSFQLHEAKNIKKSITL